MLTDGKAVFWAPRLRLLHSCPTFNGRTNQSEVGAFIVDEAQANVCEEDVVQAIAGFDGDSLTFQSVANCHQGAPPSNASTRSNLSRQHTVLVLYRW